ncbi:hypothetical protein [Arthrobacter sp. PAMC25284]|uniref:hypothetical protein n=1 Tax=Arthrobacter sp. PAMC25284 TaxID=2861279 RepID=UPI001C630C20|nr:hypothetical protein [Arthrobacter sp. PAMC25284]QYF91057.1 hypothetical protein KY499_07665 [Arthrobacter sp. PAMC25284]
MARIIGFLLFLTVMVYVIAATLLFVVALVITVAIVKHVRARHRVAQRAAMAAKLHHDRRPIPRSVPGPAPDYLRRWSVQRRWYVAGDKDDWDKAFRDAELLAQVCPAGPGAYMK